MIKRNQDPFLLRAVEYWLDSSNELGYQPLFCEWLITQGFALKYSIKNTSFEFGKDVVATDPKGKPCAYQLKGGNINLKRFRSEVLPEIEAMIDCPIEHPEISKKKNHVSFLVTNGEIDDSTREQIVRLNQKKWKNTPLRLLTRGDLLSGFQKIAEGILPQDAHTYKNLMDLIFSDGKGLPDHSAVSAFLMQILNTEANERPKEQRRRDIAAAFLYATMMAGTYRKNENHVGVVHIMTVLLSLIFYVVDKFDLEELYWIESYRVIWRDIISTSKALEIEINTKGFNFSYDTLLDKELVPYRKHGAVSVIIPLKLSQLIEKDDNWKSFLEPYTKGVYKGAITIWGEASLVPLIMLAIISRNIEKGEKPAEGLLRNAISNILLHSGRSAEREDGLISPYYDLGFSVKRQFDLLEEELEDTSKLSSYLLKPLVEMAARNGSRRLIEESWREISFICFEEFIPDNAIGQYLWRSESGENRTTIPNKQQSWKALQDGAKESKREQLPNCMRKFPSFLPFFLSVFPFRANSVTLGFLDEVSCSS